MKYQKKVCRVYKDLSSPLNLSLVFLFDVEPLQHVSYVGSI